MKKLNSNWLLISLVCVIAILSSCSDSESKEILPNFPSKQTVSIKANETEKITFDANMSWKLTSSQTWCKFIENDTEEYSLSGTEGKQSITIKVTDENLSFDESKAIVKLQMGTQTEGIVEVIRSAKDYELTIFDAEDNIIEAIEVGYSDYITFTVHANFDFAAIEKPEWVNLEGETIIGSANEKVLSGAIVEKNGENEKYPIEASNSEVITFANEEGTASFDIPVFFKGMDADIIKIEENTPWHWNVTMDGQNFKQENNLEPERAPSYEGSVPFTITTLNDDYKFLYAEISNGKYWITDDNGETVSWMSIENRDESGKISVKVEEFIPSRWGPQTREGTVLAFPAATYETAAAELEDGTDYDEFSSKYDENILIELTQKKPQLGIEVKQSGYLDVDVRKETDTDVLTYINYDLDIEDVYAMDVDGGAYFTMNPKIENFGDDDGTTIGTFYAVTLDGNMIDNEELNLNIAGVDQSSFYYLAMNTPSPFESAFIVVFIDQSWQEKKALVVYPK